MVRNQATDGGAFEVAKQAGSNLFPTMLLVKVREGSLFETTEHVQLFQDEILRTWGSCGLAHPAEMLRQRLTLLQPAQ